jgi:hypothetical protein
MRNRWQGIFEPIPYQALGSKSTVLSVGWRGDVEDAWLHMSEANARLIAAAPDLLEALKAFAEHFGPLEDNEMIHPNARRCFGLTRAAIAKATAAEDLTLGR